MREKGFTLLECMLVTAILGALALVAIPAVSSYQGDVQAALAAGEVADALRFARAEALRTGRPHGVEASAAAQQVRLYRLDFSVDPPDREYVVRHPLDKKLYDLQFQAAGPLAGARLESVAIRYAGLEPGQAFLHFDARGTPRLYDAGALRRLESAIIRVSGAGDEVLLQVNPVTGRVTAL